MITLMRKHHKVLMFFITLLVCISFSWYWNKTDFSQMGSGMVGMVYGRNVSQAEFQRNARLFRLCSELGMRDLARALTVGAQTENEAYENFSWNLLILRHEAEELGIRPTTSEIAAMVKTLPAFNGAQGFDLAKYTDFVDHGLAPMGFSEGQIEELAADQIALDDVQKLLAVGVSVPEPEMRQDFAQAYSKNDVAVVRFNSADFAKDVQVNDADVAKYYASHKAQLRTDEKRQVRFVSFALSAEQKKLTGKARIDVLQKLADNANDFTDALQAKGADFEAVATKFKLTPNETGEFSQTDPAPQFNGSPELIQAAFGLTNAAPNSEAIQAADGFYIEHLVKIDEARPLTLAEAHTKIVEALKQERIQGLLTAKAATAAKQLRDAVESGKPVAAAATEANLKLEQVPSFALLDNPPGASPAKSESQPEVPDMDAIKETVSEMKPGSVSDLVPIAKGGMIVALEKRAPLDEAQFKSAWPQLQDRALRSRGQIVFYEWLRERRRAAGVEETKPQRVATG